MANAGLRLEFRRGRGRGGSGKTLKLNIFPCKIKRKANIANTALIEKIRLEFSSNKG